MADDRIDRLRIASPCSVSWDAMEGDERVRHCALCSLNVYNFAGMTRDEVRALLDRTEGRVCARLYRRVDGTVLTRDCPTGIRALRRRASRAAVAAVAALLSLPALVFGAATSKDSGVKFHGAKIKLTVEQAAAPQALLFTGVVALEDVPLPGATVTLRNDATGRVLTTITDVTGAFSFRSLSDGSYRADVMLEGFQPGTIEHLELSSGAVTHASIRLHVAEMLMGIVFTRNQAPSHDPLSTTFPQNFIDKLPMSDQ